MPKTTIKDAKGIRIKATEELRERLANTSAIGSVYLELQNYPVKLLRQIISEHKKRQTPVPDHSLDFQSSLGETALRALVEAELVERFDGSPYAIHSYLPTAEGIRLERLIL